MIEIRIHGRGGQGAVTTSQLLAIGAFEDGKQSQGFPNFGVERRGAPSNAFVRIDDKLINIRSQIYNPDCVLVLDASLFNAINVTEGLKKKGLIIINSAKKPEEFKLDGFKIHTVDATHIAMEVFGKPIINTAIVGAYAAITGQISLDSLLKACDQRFGAGELAEKNKEAVKRTYEALKNE
ncbi:pyruvate ferredoxin oxidoreductase subunit gamma [Candidatus Woesearchaeota archaeon]|nr:pyruvate ferredoxin oxidoreductase subunit gamma [Candidatus Woesearchaeota archaeon]